MLSFIVFPLASVCQAPLAVFSPQTSDRCISSPKSLDQRPLRSDRGQEQSYRHHEHAEVHRFPPGTSLPGPSRRFSRRNPSDRCISSPKSLNQRPLRSAGGQEQSYRHHEHAELHRLPPGISLPGPSRRFLAAKSHLLHFVPEEPRPALPAQRPWPGAELSSSRTN